MDYYKKTILEGKKPTAVMSLEDYKATLFADAPKLSKVDVWNYLSVANCYGNAQYLCSFNGLFSNFGERYNYCEGVVVTILGLSSGKPTAVHHSFIYSTKYDCYVDCTPNQKPNQCFYFISDEVEGDKLNELIDTLDDESVPSFIHSEEPLGLEVECSWIMKRLTVIQHPKTDREDQQIILQDYSYTYRADE